MPAGSAVVPEAQITEHKKKKQKKNKKKKKEKKKQPTTSDVGCGAECWCLEIKGTGKGLREGTYSVKIYCLVHDVIKCKEGTIN